MVGEADRDALRERPVFSEVSGTSARSACRSTPHRERTRGLLLGISAETPVVVPSERAEL
jgi:hypothetical protein